MGRRVAVVTGVLAVLVCWTAVCRGQVDTASLSPLAYSSPASCQPNSHIFLSGRLSCMACGANSQPSPDGQSCVCSPGARRTIGDVTTRPTCTPCNNQEVTSQDSLYCLSCDPPLVYDPGSTSCSSCGTLQVYVDTLPGSPGVAGGRGCGLCPPGTWADQSGFTCVECGIQNCSLCSQSDTHGGLCFPSSSLPSLPSPPPFTYYTQQLAASAGLCWSGNQIACQRLINLCVLQHYLRSDPACAEVVSLSSSPSSPWLRSPFYPERSADTILTDTKIQSLFHTGGKPENELDLVVAVYALNGTLLEFADLSNQLLLCQGLTPDYDEAAKEVGLRFKVECEVGVASLSGASHDPVFYDLYLRDQYNSSYHLHPIPVLPGDYVDETGTRVNRGRDKGAWQLVTRFFLSEAVSSSPRYAQNMMLTIELDSNGHIFIPYLHVDYETWEPAPTTSDKLKVSFSVHYYQDITPFHITLSVLLVVMAIGVGVVTMLRVNGFLRRTSELCCTLPTYVFVVVEFCGTLSSCLFLLLSVSCTVILLLYKGQTRFLYVLPTPSQLALFYTLIPMTLLFRIVPVAYLIWTQCRIDIFFMDWERPKGVFAPTNQIQGQPDVAPPTSGPVSIWRTYLVASRWNKLMSARRGFPYLQLLLSLLLLQVAGLRHLAEHDPTGHVTLSPWRYSAPHSPILRFSLTVLVFTAVAIAIRLYVILLHERFLEHKTKHFIDLCSVSNISVVIISQRCHGYYIHGRSVHGRADTDMREMNSNLHKEQEDMCARRGLLPDSDLQTFQIALTQQFRTQYDIIMAPLMAARGLQQGRGVAREGMSHPHHQNGVSDTTVSAYEHMNHFFFTFIEHNLHDNDYTVKKKLLVERLMDMELHGPEDRCVFYEDPGLSFSQLLFYGQEWSLWQLELLVFAFVDLLATDYTLSAILTFLLTSVISVLRYRLGQWNTKQKTLLDDRFL